jgi:uroporphyrinogen-III synthase
MNNNKELRTLLIKHRDATRFLYICAEIRKDEIPNFMASNNFNFAEGMMYRTVPNDLRSSEAISEYDMLIFSSARVRYSFIVSQLP